MLIIKRTFTGACLLAALGVMIIPASASEVEQTKVTVDYAKSAGSGKATTIYCNVDTPFNYQISSHANAELISTLPVGTVVKKGDIISVQDPIYLQNEIDLLEVARRQAKVNSRFFQQEYNRLSALGKEDMVSKSRLNELASTRSTSQLDVEAFSGRLDIARYKLGKLQQRAPIKGEIIQLDASLGERLTAGSAIMQILPIAHKQLKCKMSYALYQEYHQLTTASFQLDQQTLALKRQGQHLDETLQVMDLYLALDSASAEALMVGQRLKVTVHEAQTQVTIAPYDALIIEKDSYHMWFVDESNKVSKLAVKVLRTNEAHYTIESALKPGDRVVIKGKQGLSPGQVVEPILAKGAVEASLQGKVL